MAPATLVESPNIIRLCARLQLFNPTDDTAVYRVAGIVRINCIISNSPFGPKPTRVTTGKKESNDEFYRITTRRQDLNKIRPVSSTKKVISEIIKPNEHDTVGCNVVIRKLQNSSTLGSLGIFFILFDIISRFYVNYYLSLIVCYNSSHIFLLFLCSFRTSLMQCTKPKRFTVKFTTRHFIVIINDSINTYQGSSRVCFQPYEFKQIEKIITDKLSGIIFDCLFPNFCCFKSIRFNHISLFIKLIINVYF
uniref:Uncharacterized protein n=1 Tax=Heterorhabditis bacteriophora TaxID=37862 RepID=A0A1I7WHN3_HETBA